MPVAQADESVEAAIRDEARRAGVDPDLLVAIAVQESGLNPNAIGDNGNSKGPFQENVNGRGAGRTAADSMNVRASARRAAAEVKQFAARNPKDTPGQIAAKAQRPANAGAYAQSVDRILGGMREGLSALDAKAGAAGKGGVAPTIQPGVVAAGARMVPRRPSVRPEGAVLVKAGRDQAPTTGKAGGPGITVVKGPRAMPRSPQLQIGANIQGPAQGEGERFWPIAGARPGAVNNPFGATQYHSAGSAGLALPPTNTGADLAGAYGAPVIAEMPGFVEEVYQATGDSRSGTGRNAKENAGYGGSVVVRYADGSKARYSHQATGSIVVVPGQQVAGGQLLGQVGDSGNATGAHVDYMSWGPDGQLRDGPGTGRWTPGRVTAGAVPGVPALRPGQAGKANAANPKFAAPAPKAPPGPISFGAEAPPASGGPGVQAPTPAKPVQPPQPTTPTTPAPDGSISAEEAAAKWAASPQRAAIGSQADNGQASRWETIPHPDARVGAGKPPGIDLTGATGRSPVPEAPMPEPATTPQGPPPVAMPEPAWTPQGPESTPLLTEPPGGWGLVRPPLADTVTAGGGVGGAEVDESPSERATREAQQRDADYWRNLGKPKTSTPTPGVSAATAQRNPGDNPLGGIGSAVGGVFDRIGTWVNDRTKPQPGAAGPGGQPDPETEVAAAASTPDYFPTPPDPIPVDPSDGPELKRAKAQAQKANTDLYEFALRLAKARQVLEKAKGVVPGADDLSPAASALRDADSLLRDWKDETKPAGKEYKNVVAAQEKAADTLAKVQQGVVDDASGGKGSQPPGSFTDAEGQTYIRQPDGRYLPAGQAKKPGVTITPGTDSVRVFDPEGNLVNEVPVTNMNGPSVLAGSDGPELLIYDPSDGSMWWQPNRSFLNTPQQVAAAAKDKYIVSRDKVTGELKTEANPSYNPRESDTVLVSATGRSIRLDETGKLISQSDTLTPEEREVYDKRSKAESEQAVTKSQSDQFKLEQDKKEAEEWQRIEDAVKAGASPAQVRALVVQAAKNVTDFVNLQNAETSRQTQLEVGRHNLAEEGFSARTRRTAEAGEARSGAESYNRYGLATAPSQTALLGSLSQVADPRKVAGTMNIAPSVFEPVGQQYDQHQQMLANTAKQGQQVADEAAKPWFGTSGPPGQPGAQPGAGTPPAPSPSPSPAPSSGQAGGNYGASNPAAPAAPAGQPGQRQVDPNPDRQAVDLGNGQARTYYTDGTWEDWAIPQTPPAEEPAPDEQPVEAGGGYGLGGGDPQQEAARARRARQPVRGKHAIALGGGWARTQYDDGSFEDWHVEDGPSWEGVGGGGAGYWGEDPTTMGGWGYENGTGGGGGSIWQMAPPASVDVGWGAQQALANADPQRRPDGNAGGMAGGFAGPTPAAGRGGGAYGAAGQAQAPMWDSATPAPFATSGVSGTSGAAGQSTLYRPGASSGTGMGAGLGGGRSGQPTTGYYGGPAMPQAMSPLQRLLQQTGVVPLSAGRAAGSPGTV